MARQLNKGRADEHGDSRTNFPRFNRGSRVGVRVDPRERESARAEWPIDLILTIVNPLSPITCAVDFCDFAAAARPLSLSSPDSNISIYICVTRGVPAGTRNTWNGTFGCSVLVDKSYVHHRASVRFAFQTRMAVQYNRVQNGLVPHSIVPTPPMSFPAELTCGANVTRVPELNSRCHVVPL